MCMKGRLRFVPRTTNGAERGKHGSCRPLCPSFFAEFDRNIEEAFDF